MNEDATRFPLSWPDDQPRTAPDERDVGRYTVSFSDALHDTLHELDMMGAKHVVVSSDVQLRRDGLPRAGAAKRVDDPGVAVYWTRDGQDYVVACDSYNSVRSNLRAIGLTIHHLRRLEAAAPAFLADRAYQGFARLPEKTVRSWRQVLGFDRAQKVAAEDVRGRYLALVKKMHPDHGGTDSQMADLNWARNEALREIG